MTNVVNRRVLRRKVFFIHGFDPRAGQNYKDQYAAESQTQTECVEYGLTVTDLGGEDEHSSRWKTSWHKEGWPVTVTDFDAFQWGDLVRNVMRGGVVATVRSALRSFSILMKTGALRSLVRLDTFKAIAFLIPYIVVMAQFLFAFGVAALGMTYASGILPFWGALLTAVSLFVLFFWLVRRTRGFFMTSYSLHLYGFCLGQYGAYSPETEARIGSFKEQVIAALDEDYDEVVVIGHSFGANLAMSTVADVLASGDMPEDGPELSLVTIGAFLINMIFLPEAWRQRRDMQALAGQSRVAWFDLSAQADRYIFSLFDPVKACGVAPEPQFWPKIVPVRYRHNLRLVTYKTLRRSFFDTHLQYIKAFDRPRDYDYFDLTAGQAFVRDYFAGRKSMPRGEGETVGRYQSTAPDGSG